MTTEGHVAEGRVGRASTVEYIVITPDGELVTRVADNVVSRDEWGGWYQDSLWTAVATDVDPYHRTVNGAGVQRLRVKMADAGRTCPELYPPNPVADLVLAELGAAHQGCRGAIAIVGAEDDDGITHSLTPEQHRSICSAYLAATTARPCG